MIVQLEMCTTGRILVEMFVPEIDYEQKYVYIYIYIYIYTILFKIWILLKTLSQKFGYIIKLATYIYICIYTFAIVIFFGLIYTNISK